MAEPRWVINNGGKWLQINGLYTDPQLTGFYLLVTHIEDLHVNGLMFNSITLEYCGGFELRFPVKFTKVDEIYMKPRKFKLYLRSIK